MNGYPGWTLNANDVIALPVDEFGPAILRDVTSDESAWHAGNWLQTAVAAY